MLLIISLYSRTELQILKRTGDNSLAWDTEKETLREKSLNNREEQVDSKRGRGNEKGKKESMIDFKTTGCQA